MCTPPSPSIGFILAFAPPLAGAAREEGTAPTSGTTALATVLVDGKSVYVAIPTSLSPDGSTALGIGDAIQLAVLPDRTVRYAGPAPRQVPRFVASMMNQVDDGLVCVDDHGHKTVVHLGRFAGTSARGTRVYLDATRSIVLAM